MSLDVYLTVQSPVTKAIGSGIFIRDKKSGGNKEISREEWERRFPGETPFTVQPQPEEETEETIKFFSGNITHNLGSMAKACDIYDPLWRPDECGITQASQLIEPLELAIAKL